ncbi:MAG: hypothetical protein ACREEC_13470 [Thermoplasmata archaeon]
MPLPGGPAGKVGIRYERSWTVLQMLRILEGTAERIRIEPPGAAGEGFEFRLDTPEGVEWHQVKRQLPSDSWTVAALAKEGVLRHFGPRLRAGERCVFVSQVAAERLRELADRSRLSFEEFLAEGLKGGRDQEFGYCKREWAEGDDYAVYRLLQFISIETISERSLKSW